MTRRRLKVAQTGCSNKILEILGERKSSHVCFKSSGFRRPVTNSYFLLVSHATLVMCAGPKPVIYDGLYLLQAAVRSSRRKRNQYVQDLRQHVDDLKRRKHDAMVENALLKQLTSLWERLCSEVENEIQDGVNKQLNLDVPTRLKSPERSSRSRSSSAARIRTKATEENNNDGSKPDPLVFVVVPPAATDDVAEEAVAASPATYELQLQDEVVPVIITSPQEEQDFNNGRNFVKIAPRQPANQAMQQQQRVLLLKTDTKGV